MNGDKSLPAGAERLAQAAQAGAQRYVPQPPAHNLEDFGGGKREKLANPGSASDLIPEYKDLLSKEELLNTADAMKLYNDGMTAEQFLTTPVGKKISRYAHQDQAEFQEMAMKKPDLSDPELVKAHKRALAAEYFFTWLQETLGKAEQAAQTLRLEDDAEREGAE